MSGEPTSKFSTGKMFSEDVIFPENLHSANKGNDLDHETEPPAQLEFERRRQLLVDAMASIEHSLRAMRLRLSELDQVGGVRG
jgi:hypothetical protein